MMPSHDLLGDPALDPDLEVTSITLPYLPELPGSCHCLCGKYCALPITQGQRGLG